MRICSLLPSTTEILCALGLIDNIVGITHECDYPPEINGKNRVVISNIKTKNNSSKEIDEVVKRNAQEGKSTYLIDSEKLELANPDIIFTQGLCEVCAVSGNQVLEAVQVLNKKPQIVSLQPETIEEILTSIITVGEITNKTENAEKVVENIRNRINTVKKKVSNEVDKPRVFCLEWLDPPFVAGHWVPDMVKIAGGDYGLRKKGEVSIEVSWKDIVAYAPNYLIIMPCGFNVDRTLSEIDTVTSLAEWQQILAVKKGHTYIVDANSYFSRPSPRTVQGIETIARIIHPELFKNEYSTDPVINLRNYYHLQSFLG